MPTLDTTHVLFKIAHPDLYERNPFNVLNLPVTATARDIRRRKEDIEAAFDAGNESEEFADILPPSQTRKPPTRGEVQEAFAALEDPEKRIAYALFWFWPDGGTGKEPCPNKMLYSKGSQEFAPFFEKGPPSDGWSRHSLLGRHNLAVFHHMVALFKDHAYLLDVEDDSTPADDEEVRECHWSAAIDCWDMVVRDSETWHEMADLVTALGDPRVDYRFVRSLRDQFAFAFDQINVELAITYAKEGMPSEAKKQVEYMIASQPGADDVEGTLDDAFSGLLRQTEAIVNAARKEANQNPRDGLRQANQIIERTKEPLRVSRIVLEKGSTIRNAIVTVVFEGARSCLIAYGNTTTDWDGCLEFMSKLLSMAETPDQKTKAMEDENALRQFARNKELRETCWKCKKKLVPEDGDGCSEVKLWGKIERGESFGNIKFKTRVIRVPTCRNCKTHKTDCSDYPAIKAALSEGWKIGDGPTEVDALIAWCNITNNLMQRTSDNARPARVLPKDNGHSPDARPKARGAPPPTAQQRRVVHLPRRASSKRLDKQKRGFGYLEPSIIDYLPWAVLVLAIIGLIALALADNPFGDITREYKRRREIAMQQKERENARNRLRREMAMRLQERNDARNGLWEERRQPMPENGAVRRVSGAPGVAPLTVSTRDFRTFGDNPSRSGNWDTPSGVSFLVKIRDARTKKEILDMFVRGGSSATVDVPAGTYEILYASGTQWYGYDWLFGPQTLYSKANETFSFTPGYGYEITLQKVRDGNLSTKAIGSKDF